MHQRLLYSCDSKPDLELQHIPDILNHLSLQVLPSIVFSLWVARGASNFGKANPLPQPFLCSPLHSLFQFFVTSEARSQSSLVLYSMLGLILRGLMTTLPSKYSTSWMRRCWYCLNRRCRMLVMPLPSADSHIHPFGQNLL